MPAAWAKGSVFPAVQEHYTWQPDHNDQCIDEVISPKKPQKGLENYSPKKILI